MVAATFAFAQRSNDPGLSANNYKHPDKAAYARKHNLDKHTRLESVTVSTNGDYKHPNAKRRTASRATISTSKGMNPAASHKHPLGF